ncbi:valine--tRNA ligase [Acholeplasma hippikon]|uniref:Valine--tRNA ligase n=1 Tax=Acholeplasma hippikon TaxID=264636 RepID=A0A449BIK3_9MOLU|nr:valine--tRNA ligase [Acholeplasma hippikon]VEU82285.1 Valine--tRNA ligase [Acholeplasma hippikon]
MKQQLSPKYDFKEVEKGRYQFWLDNEFFKAGKDPRKEPFTIVIPPPNVTGKLHLGHAWDTTIQDIIIRRKRMQGYDALYLPGMDHAGIATQAKIDERLKKQGISRYDLGRENYLVKAWEWKEEYSNFIKDQWAALGLSLDYSRERFTLDSQLNQAVNKVFIDLYNKGWIYRGYRIINWDVEAKTALSNIEVEYEETQGKLYHFNYPFVDGTGHLEIATTRPETMFADQALMVHPEDSRYKAFIGKKVFIPGTNREIPVIADDYVDMAFGTGVVKVTPAHDPNDYEVAKRHQLEMPLCMNEDGTMNEMAGKYQGQERFECRKNVTNDLKALGLCPLVEEYTHQVGYSERTGVMVEPRLSLQWFVDMKGLSKQTLENNQVEFVPERFRKTFENWMTNIQDWTISRQLWWGHRIPAWFKGEEVKVQIECPGEGWVQDEDVLDTWFSSALWPFSTLGWPNTEHPDFKRYYPTNVLVTGYDIIFFWVSRMMFQGLEFTGKDPFKQVLLHGLIRDKEGRKMSKSLGNGVDPMDVVAKYGIDALRNFIVSNSAPGMDTRYDEEKIEASWNFINKLWNITRFLTMNIEDASIEINEAELTVFDKWILTRLSETIKEADNFYEKYEFNEVSRVLQNFIWNEFASWYLEISKVSLQNPKLNKNTQAVLLYVLKDVLKLMHPFIPFVTEKLFLEIYDEKSIMVSSWPEAKYDFSNDKQVFAAFEEIVTKVRTLRNEYNVAPSKPLDIILETKSDKVLGELKDIEAYLIKFLNSKSLQFNETSNNDTVLLAGTYANIHVVKSDLIDLKAEKEALLKQKETLEKEIARSEGLLNNQSFISKAPEQKLAIEREKYANYQKQYEDVLEKLKKHVQ